MIFYKKYYIIFIENKKGRKKPMDDYWDSFDCEIQCEEVYSEDYEYSSVE